VTSMDRCVDDVRQRLDRAKRDWLQRLRRNPREFCNVEKDIHATRQGLADQLTASLLAEATTDSAPMDAAKKK